MPVGSISGEKINTACAGINFAGSGDQKKDLLAGELLETKAGRKQSLKQLPLFRMGSRLYRRNNIKVKS